MALPGFLVRKLYKKGSLRETADGFFAFTIHNPLGSATIISPPVFTINGIRYGVEQLEAEGVDLAAISESNPMPFTKGMAIDIRFPGRLLRGGNRVHMTATTKEFGGLELFIEDREADYCDLPYGEEE